MGKLTEVVPEGGETLLVEEPLTSGAALLLLPKFAEFGGEVTTEPLLEFPPNTLNAKSKARVNRMRPIIVAMIQQVLLQRN